MALLFFSVLFPVVFIILQDSNVYNGIRHLLFVFPPIVALSALGWRYLFNSFGKSTLQYSLIAILAFSMLESSIWMLRSHPHQVMYFNSLFGGADEAFNEYELDYWGISTKEAIEWVDKNTPDKTVENPVRIKMYYGDRIKANYYTDR